MASRLQDQTNDPHRPPLSSSPDSLSEPNRSTQSNSVPRPSNLMKRSSSVRFSNDTADIKSQMSTRRRSEEVDEITPIRNANNHTERNYNTTEEAVNTGKSTAKPSAPTDPTETEESSQSWFKKVAEKFGSVSLENKGSVARDHLALERTFLAWLRTSLAFASIGIAVTQLFRLNTSIQTRTGNPTPPALQNSLPLSPLLGHGLPLEMIPLLQQLAYTAAQSLPTPPPPNTLLDSLLSLSMSDSSLDPSMGRLEFDEHAATRLRRVGKPLGATFIGVSIIVLLIGFHRYFESQHWIIQGKFPASRGSVAFVGIIAGALVVASLIIVLVVAPIKYERR